MRSWRRSVSVLEATLRTEWPELFDRRGRLRRKVLAQRLAARTGGKAWLSGDDLLALEETDGKVAAAFGVLARRI